MVQTEEKRSTTSLAQLLGTLSDLDAKITTIEEILTKTNTTLHENKILALQISLNLEELSKQAIAMRKKVTLGEQEIKYMRLKEDEKRAHLESLQTEKEYRTASREVELLKKHNMQAEQTLLADWQTAESLDQALALEQSMTQKKLDELTLSTLECFELVKKLKDEHQLLLEEKKQKLALIPSEWVSRYNQMQASVTNPVVAAAHGCCSGCFYAIVPQEYTRIKKGEILLCQSCYRFLYFDTEKETPCTP